MKKAVLIFSLFLIQQINAQQQSPLHMVRIYEDNDFINIRGKGTDNAYTNGTRFDYFYTPKKQSHFIVDRLLPKGGSGSVNTYSWSLMQLMFTPNDITTKYYQPNDYTYSGALVASHTLYSFNPVKKFGIQTEAMLGVQGPASGAKEAQQLMHRVISYKKPMGWQNQSKNRLLANINVTVEKQLAAYKKSVEFFAAAQATAGNITNSFTLSPQVRIGKMNPYFNGIISQHSAMKQKRGIQYYLVIKPSAMLVLSNTLLTGKPASPVLYQSKETTAKNNALNEDKKIKNMVYLFDCSAVIAKGNFSISFTQTSASPMLQHLYSHEVGNISLHYSW